jgi:hypothetical protein
VKQSYQRTRIRVDDYIADSLEREASLMPPGFEGNAEILRQQAKFFRESARTEMVTVWKPAGDE